MRLSAGLFLAAMLGALAGCGSGQAIPQVFPAPVSPTGGPVAATAASLQLLSSSTTIASAGTTTVDLTAIVLDSSKQVLIGRTVTFSTGTDPSAFVNNISNSGLSDANGMVTAKLNLGNIKTKRTITVTATADSMTASNPIEVTGTTLNISGTSSLALNAPTPTPLTFSVKDSAGNPMPNITVSVSSKNGNTIDMTAAGGTQSATAGTAATGVTDAAGQVTAKVTATVANQTDTLSASAAGVSAKQDLTISTASFTIDASNPLNVVGGATPCPGINKGKNNPPETPEIPLAPDVCSTPTVTVNWTEGGAAKSGQPVSFSPSRGTIVGSPAITDAAGNASVTISSTSAGPVTITATGSGGTPSVTFDAVFVATSASSATVQAIPGTVLVTPTGGTAVQTNNTSTISVLVRDAQNNLVKNALVNFKITNDPTGGFLKSPSGITDVSGSTSVTYQAGGISSAQNGVTISATVTSVNGVNITPQVTGTTSLTVAGQSLLVRLGTDNKVATSGTNNVKTYSAIVTDASGNPSVGTQVQFTLRPGHYEKGIFLFNDADKVWVPVFSLPAIPGACPNMDINFNGILDPGEDTRPNTAFSHTPFNWTDSTGAAVTPHLLPGAVASVNATATTDASGVATATLTYPKDHSYWTEVTLEARTSVTSNDPPTWVTFYLPGPATDYGDPSTPPPGQYSPFGTDTVCWDLF